MAGWDPKSGVVTGQSAGIPGRLRNGDGTVRDTDENGSCVSGLDCATDQTPLVKKLKLLNRLDAEMKDSRCVSVVRTLRRLAWPWRVQSIHLTKPSLTKSRYWPGFLSDIAQRSP